jgi:hypothetical protein
MTGLYHGWSDEPDTHADFIHGGVDIDDFDDVIRHRKKAKKVRPKKKPGCPGNEGKAHIYVWTTEFNFEDCFFKFFGFHKYEKKFCAGCNKKAYATRKTEQYIKKFNDSTRWGSPEYRHEGYKEYVTRWRVQRGWTRELYGNF